MPNRPFCYPRRESVFWMMVAVVVGINVTVGTAGEEPNGEPSIDARLSEGLVRLRTKEFDKAHEAFRSALSAAQSSNNADAIMNCYFYLGLTRQTQAETGGPHAAADIRKWLNEAQRNYWEAAKLRPESGGCWNNLALVNSRLGDTDAAVAAFLRAIATRNRNQTTYLLNYGDFLLQSGKADEAARFYVEALEQEPLNKRARESLNQYYLKHEPKELGSYLWKLFDEGHVDWAEEVALSALEQGLDDPAFAKQALTCVVRCLAKRNYDPDHFSASATGQRLIALSDRRPFRAPVHEILTLHRAETFDPEQYPWWRDEVVLEAGRYAPRGGWPQSGFTELIRAIGEGYERHGNLERAETYYRLAYRLTPRYLDPVAIVKLADMWVRNNQRDRLLAFLEAEESNIFEGKGEAIRVERFERMYEIHRALAIIYMYLGRWSDPSTYKNAEFQLQAALDDAELFNRRAQADGRPERIADSRLATDLSERYLAEGRKADAFEIRVKTAEHYFEFGEPGAAAAIFRPVANEPPPEGTSGDVIKTFRGLNSTWEKNGFRSFDQGADARFNKQREFELPDGTPAVLLLGDDAADRAAAEQILNAFEQRAQGRTKPNLQPDLGNQKRIDLLPQSTPEDLLRIEFDGSRGKASLRREGEVHDVPFKIRTSGANSALTPFKAVRP